ncbi:unnamed protein product [Caenorhabditis sp. 36 PRJEB53466]|nr:unnamed protein product [Caenorhabditis sp. 36 PRJEB53466]
MKATVYVVSGIGLIFSLFTTAINILLVYRNIRSRNKANTDMTLFFYRFVLDALMGSALGIYLSLTVSYLIFPSSLAIIRDYVGLIGLPSSNAAAARALIVLFINVERCLAVYFPMFYHKLRRDLVLTAVLATSVSFGFFEDVVLFVLCDFSSFIAPPGCLALGCAFSACFHNYWIYYKNVTSSITFVFSVGLCARLLYSKYWGGTKVIRKSYRMNYLAVIDVSIVLLFNFMPSFLANIFPDSKLFSFEHVGPYSAVCKLFGSTVDAVLAYYRGTGQKGRAVRNLAEFLGREVIFH